MIIQQHKRVIQRLVEQFKDDPRFPALIISGSVAKGRARKDSDIDIVLVAIAYFAADRLYRPGAPSTIMGLWIAVLVFGLGAFVLRRTRFAAMRLKDIAALKGISGLLKTLQDTTIQIAFIGGAIALMGFIIDLHP